MANIVDSTIEWLKDESTGVPVGFKKKDGTEGGLVTSQVDPVTGVLIKTMTVITLTDYTALAVKDPNTEYNVIAG